MSPVKRVAFGASVYAATTVFGFALFCRLAVFGECLISGQVGLGGFAKLSLITASPLILLGALSSWLLVRFVFRENALVPVPYALLAGFGLGFLPQVAGAILSGAFLESLYPSGGYLPFMCAGIVTAVFLRYISDVSTAQQEKITRD